jgi:hypothetical protein
MTDLVPKAICVVWGVIGVTYAAVCIWIGVRLFNRRERWVKGTALALAILPVLFALSSGPMSMIGFESVVRHTPTVLPDGTTVMSASGETGISTWFPMAYAPLFWVGEYTGGDFVFQYWMLFPHHTTFVKP